ncbi:polysaccharide deacetylase family protein [Paenibacillus vulneris]|uniref:Polysaccharide deacetylase family protein n=1 Tax=Paenibacillus vulneris TaxID=1133364 RepID=A0ABW3UMR4_9BACL|nr:polysaccharide deacetylase family protein [Paenibacillus sp. 32352]
MPKILMTYPQGKFKVLTMSYDDGRAADRRLVQIFNDYGIKGAFHINSGLMGTGDRITKEEAAELYKGQEVSTHTVTHPTIVRSPREQLLEEVLEDRKALEKMVGYTVRGLSYPNGSFNRQIKETLPYLGIEYARVVETTGGFGLPDDWMEWKPTCHHKRNLMSLAETFVELHKKQYLYMMYVWGHSYEFDTDNNWDLIENFCQYISNKDDIWYATNIEIVDYFKAFRQLQFSASSEFVYNPSAKSVWISVDGDILEIRGGEQVSLV